MTGVVRLIPPVTAAELKRAIAVVSKAQSEPIAPMSIPELGITIADNPVSRGDFALVQEFGERAHALMARLHILVINAYELGEHCSSDGVSEEAIGAVAEMELAGEENPGPARILAAIEARRSGGEA